jgi:hypothetical protein
VAKYLGVLTGYLHLCYKYCCMNEEILPNKVYSSEEAAEILGMNRVVLQRYCRQGIIKARKVKDWLILGQSLIDFLQGDAAQAHNALNPSKSKQDS